jgi:integrase
MAGQAKTTSLATANLQLKIARMIFRDAFRQGLVAENPAEKVRRLNSPKNADRSAGRRPFTVDEISKLLHAAAAEDRHAEWTGMILLGLYTGQRLGDIRLARHEDIAENVWTVRAGKTGRAMRIPLAAPVVAWIDTRRESTGYLFPKAAGLSRSGTLSNQFHALMVSAGLVDARSHAAKADRQGGRSAARSPAPLSFHCFRHTLTTWLKEAGVSESVTMEFVGHESAAINRAYTHIGEASLADAVTKLPTISQP